MIVPTRNSARTLEACLLSIRAQRDQTIELIVIDNNSRDDTCAIAARYADRLEPGGPERSIQRNRGAELAAGDYLLFIDSDMRLETTVAAECVHELIRTSAPAVIIPEESTGSGFWTHCRALERSCYHGDDTVEAARFFPKLVFQASGGYDPAIIGWEDWEFSDRIGQGRSLPRIEAQISHDEGRLQLRSHLAKKRYYGRDMLRYRGGHSSNRRGNPIRSGYLRNWRRLLRHPLLTAGMFVLKTLEAGALASGIVAGWWDRKNPG